MLEAELNHHLAQQNAQGQTGNHRNGSSAKTVIPPAGDVPLEIPRARLSTFEPVRIAKYHSGACLVLMRM
ncbi:transposase [Candidatus Glomeribacter gigasporarum]|uniref:transposase n=1 Tax=Candidatus Glomeribacter gigasporarum TaxID=132144 RepID=UPI003B967993